MEAPPIPFPSTFPVSPPSLDAPSDAPAQPDHGIRLLDMHDVFGTDNISFDWTLPSAVAAVQPQSSASPAPSPEVLPAPISVYKLSQASSTPTGATSGSSPSPHARALSLATQNRKVSFPPLPSPLQSLASSSKSTGIRKRAVSNAVGPAPAVGVPVYGAAVMGAPASPSLLQGPSGSTRAKVPSAEVRYPFHLDRALPDGLISSCRLF